MELFVEAFIISHAVVYRKAAGPGHGAYAAHVHGIVHGKDPYPFQTALDGIVIEEYHGHLADFFFEFLHFFQNHFPLAVGDISSDTADFADRENDPASCGFFKNIQHHFPDAPGMHKKAFKSHGAGGQARLGLQTATGLAWRRIFDATAPVLPGFTVAKAFEF